MPHVGVDGVTRGQRLHEAHGRVLDGERHVLRGAGEGRGEKLSAQPTKAAIRPLAPSPVPRPRCSHRFSTTTTAEPSGRIRATMSKPFFLLACSPTLWEPSGMNLLGGSRHGQAGAHSLLTHLRSHSHPTPQPEPRPKLRPHFQFPVSAGTACSLPAWGVQEGQRCLSPPTLTVPLLALGVGGTVGPMQETPAWCGLGGPPSTHLKWPR